MNVKRSNKLRSSLIDRTTHANTLISLAQIIVVLKVNQQ